MVVAAALGLAACSAGTAEAERIGTAFCAAVTARDAVAATALMTPQLQAQIARLRAFDLRFRAKRPGDKPPLGDGLRLTAFPDAVTGCRVEAETALTVVVAYVPAGVPDGGWRDRLLLVRNAEGDLQVGDIAFAGDNRVRLRGWLNEAMTE
jgi:hypothetical protein